MSFFDDLNKYNQQVKYGEPQPEPVKAPAAPPELVTPVIDVEKEKLKIRIAELESINEALQHKLRTLQEILGGGLP